MMMLIAMAAVIAQPLVTPDDPLAHFRGDGTSLKMDPACRDFNLETVASDAACAARIAAAEPAPSLAIAVQTISQVPARSSEAMTLLERSATISDHPAVHYLLGNLLASPSILKPDYGAATRHLTVAADRGNPAAADLLATLILEGKGVRRDVPRAIQLYEKAAANGFPSAAVSLGKLYLMGRYVPVNEARGRAWLNAAAVVGAPSATQLAALASGGSKVNNFQLIPAARIADVKVLRFGSFDNPDIPPNFGFDPAYQSIHHAEFDDLATRTALLAGEKSNPTPYLYELARRIAPSDPIKATRTYLVARMRTTYDASRCANADALGAIQAWDLLIGPDIRFLFGNGNITKQIAQAALDEEASFPANTEPWWVCRSGIAEMTAAMEGKIAPLKLKPVSDWPNLRQAARAQIAAIADR